MIMMMMIVIVMLIILTLHIYIYIYIYIPQQFLGDSYLPCKQYNLIYYRDAMFLIRYDTM